MIIVIFFPSSSSSRLGRSADDFGVDTTTITEDDDGDNDDINNGGIDNAGLDFSQLEEYINQVDNDDHQHQLEQQQNDDTTNLYDNRFTFDQSIIDNFSFFSFAFSLDIIKMNSNKILF